MTTNQLPEDLIKEYEEKKTLVLITLVCRKLAVICEELAEYAQKAKRRIKFKDEKTELEKQRKKLLQQKKIFNALAKLSKARI